MSKKDYTKFSKAVQHTIELMEEAEIAPQNTIDCTVSDCERLNVRVNPDINAEIAFVISNGTKVQVDESRSTDEFYYICTEHGMEGFCMKKYISVDQ